VASYIFPAGGQQGTTVKVRVGGLYLYRSCEFELLGSGVRASPRLQRMRTLWFEGPLLPLPESQQAEDYPQDMAGEVTVAPDAPAGPRRGRLWTAEGAASGLTFVVGELPELVEDEIDGDPVPVSVPLPITINGRIFPRGDVDVWSLTARKGQSVTAEVMAARIGSPLDSCLEALDSAGRVLAENDDAAGADSRLRFTAPADGTYAIRIRDVNGHGGQNYVYRLTITSDPILDCVYPLGGRRGGKVALRLSGQGVPAEPVEVVLPADAPASFAYRYHAAGRPSNAVILDMDDLPEYLETEPNDTPDRAQRVSLPAVVNGRIDRPGDMDVWSFSARKGRALVLDLRAARLASPLYGVLTLTDAAGKVLSTAEATTPRGDPSLTFTAPADGTYRVRVSDRFRSRGGDAFAYRLRIGPPPAPDFRLHFDTDAQTLRRGTQAKLRISVERLGGFAGPLALTLAGLPQGIKASNTTIATGQPAAEIAFDADKTGPIGACHLSVTGTATVAGKALTRTATLAGAALPPTDSVLLAVAMGAPFKVVGIYDLRLVPRGTVHRRRYRIERNGYDGPLEVRLADHQMRHLQGVTGPALTLSPGVNEFEYPVNLPPWMETGRTARACVMAVGVIKEGGKEHEVAYTSEAQNDQIIAVVETGLLGLECERTSVSVAPGRRVELPVRVRRSRGLAGSVTVELVLPGSVRDLSAERLTIPADQSGGVLKLRCGAAPGPFTLPVVVRATLATLTGPVTAEARLEVVAEK
jgi:hypothetical protein